jgi:two-component system NtrC family sensor kinase
MLKAILSDPAGPGVDGQSALLQERFRGLQIGLDRIRMLVVELQTFSRLDPGEYTRINVADCLSSVLAVLRPRFAGRIRVESRFEAPEYIKCNPQLLTQGVLNLLANGIDAIDGKGTIQLACGAEGTNYVIVVADDGSGIPDSIRHRVMEPFFTTRSVGKGSGLGLAITYTLVIEHGGTLDLREAAAGGTEAIIRIPLANLSP